MEILRQGDVLLKRIDTIPNGQIYEEVKDRILARGEVTGHNHRLQSGRVLRNQSSQQLYVELEQPSELLHEEHGMIPVPPGFYEVIRQREYSPLDERMVSD